MISITAEYALRAVVFLGREPHRAWTTQQVAAATRVPVSYLSKVLQALVRAAIIQSVRGIYGGYRLAGPATQLTALEIINSVDPIRRIHRCPLGLESHRGRLCPLHRRVDFAVGLVEKAFAETTIGELLAEPDNLDTCSLPGTERRAQPRRRAAAPSPKRKRSKTGGRTRGRNGQ
jgi:Rrf2 family protein